MYVRRQDIGRKRWYGGEIEANRKILIEDDFEAFQAKQYPVV